MQSLNKYIFATLLVFATSSANCQGVGKIAYLFNEEIADQCITWAKESSKHYEEEIQFSAWCIKNQHKGGFSYSINLDLMEQKLLEGKPNKARLEIVIDKVFNSYNSATTFFNAHKEPADRTKLMTKEELQKYTIYILE